MARLAVALVWLYQGLWCKLLLADPAQLDILRGVPWLGENHALFGLRAFGVFEVGLALWVLSGWRPFASALAQTALLVAMNGGGLLWSGEQIAHPGAMLTQNFVFLCLAWIVAGRAAAARLVADPWKRGRLDAAAGASEVLFGWTYEDPSIELSVFPAGGRVFCIAAAGETAGALGNRGDRVTAADVNPAQVDYARGRAAGMPARPGVIEVRMARGRRFLPWLGIRERDLASFLALDDREEQVRFWRNRIATRRLRGFLRVALHPVVLRLLYPGDLVAALPKRLDRAILARLERTWSLHPNRENRWAWRLLLGREPPVGGADSVFAASPGLEFRLADAEAYFDACPPHSFDGISLSNVLDAMTASRGDRLLAAARRAAKPGARIVLRRFDEPRDATAASWAARDRSPLWGAIEVLEVRADGGCAPLSP
ncbi:MAG TPA: DoxX-like family protein [Planctomycetota bacterium]|jgi:hypothetical protein|nr:DoxX-like family protein [Planctomycetota bacterium]